MPAAVQTEGDLIRFLITCLNCTSKDAVDFTAVATELGLDKKEKAYKKLWDLKKKYPLSTGGATQTPPTTPKKPREG